MFRRLVFEDGTVVGVGGRVGDNVRRCSVVQCVNGEKELYPGAVCAAALEAVVQMERPVTVGEWVSVYSVGANGEEAAVGRFRLEKPVREKGRLYRLVGYDAVRMLDRDLTQWLASLSGWPYGLADFAGMVAGACGVELVVGQIPNGGFAVQKFYQAGVTGRQILQWVGELACRYLYADPEGVLRFGWYEDRGGQILPTGDDYYFAGALKYEDYEVAAIDGVKVRLAGNEKGLLWPDGAAENPYVIAGNPIVLARVDSSLRPYLEVIRQELGALPKYRPCKVSVPSTREIRAGDVVTVEDLYGVRFRTLVMTRTVVGQRQTLECVGAQVRGDAVDRRSPEQIAQDSVDRQSQKDIFRKLTDGGKVQGLFMGEDGNIYVNASYIKTGTLDASAVEVKDLSASNISGGTLDASKITVKGLSAGSVTTGRLKSSDGSVYFDLETGQIVCHGDGKKAVISGGDVRLYNGSGTLVAMVTADSSNGCLKLYDKDGIERLGITASVAGPMVTLWDADLQRQVSSPVCFREVGGVKVVGVG